MRLRVLLYETPDDPYYNLAFEEAVPRARGCGAVPDTLRIWRNRSAVVIGYFQRAEEEVNLDEAERRGVAVVRRFTGGGAAYHDLGNINYAVSVASKGPVAEEVKRAFGELVRAPVEALRRLGYDASVENVNDIVVAGRKVSGTAATVAWGSTFLHGALLVSASLSTLASVLRVSPKKLMDKGVSSVKYRVTNLVDVRPVGTAELVEALASAFAAVLGYGGFYFDVPSPVELDMASALLRKYRSREWNYERAPHSAYPDVEAEVARICRR